MNNNPYTASQHNTVRVMRKNEVIGLISEISFEESGEKYIPEEYFCTIRSVLDAHIEIVGLMLFVNKDGEIEAKDLETNQVFQYNRFVPLEPQKIKTRISKEVFDKIINIANGNV